MTVGSLLQSVMEEDLRILKKMLLSSLAVFFFVATNRMILIQKGWQFVQKMVEPTKKGDIKETALAK